MKKILLIDANLLLFRSFYAALAISKNNASMTTHLFFSTFFDIYKQEKPEYVFLAFDAYGKTRRHNEFAEYKAGRIKAPQELYDQKEVIRTILDNMKIKHLAIEGEEADDLIASISDKYKNDYQISILSEDKDLLQLIDKNVCLIQKNRNKNVNEKYIKINNDNFYNIYSFYPNQVVDYKGIAGDNSDNLSGIKGIGPKTTIDLLNKYKTLENIFDNLSNLTEKQQSIFMQYKENAFLCKRLATLNKNVVLDFDLDSLLVEDSNFKTDNVLDILNKYALKRISNIVKEL